METKEEWKYQQHQAKKIDEEGEDGRDDEWLSDGRRVVVEEVEVEVVVVDEEERLVVA